MEIPYSTRQVVVIALFGVCLLSLGAGAVIGSGSAPVSADEQRVVVEDQDTGDTLWSKSVDDGSEVSIEYTHSVHKSEVIEAYTVDADEDVLVSDRMIFSTYGAGMPDSADVERTEDGKFVYRTNGSHENLRIQPGSTAGHELVVDGERHDLVEISNEKAVNVRVESRSTLPVFADRLREAIEIDK